MRYLGNNKCCMADLTKKHQKHTYLTLPQVIFLWALWKQIHNHQVTVFADAGSRDEEINHDGNVDCTAQSAFQDKLDPFRESRS